MADAGVLDREVLTHEANSPIPGGGSHYIAPVSKTEDGLIFESAIQTVQGDPLTLYKFWHDLASFPLWQEHVISVTDLGGGLSHWVMGNPEEEDGKRVEYDSQITQDEPGRVIAWKSVTPEVEQTGKVAFSPALSGRGTLVTLSQAVKVPGGSLGNAVAGFAKRSPRQTVIEDLRHFKQIVESGEIPSVKGQPHGPRGLIGTAKQWMYGESNPTPPGTSEN